VLHCIGAEKRYSTLQILRVN